MRRKTGLFGFAAAFILLLLWLSQGCKGGLPAVPQGSQSDVSQVVPTPLPSGDISDFNNGTLNVNPSFLNGHGGYFLSETYGGAAGHTNMIDGSNTPNILAPNPPSPDNSAYAVHIYGPLSDPGQNNYPAMFLYLFLKNDLSDPYYDLTATPFTGVQFDINIPMDDTNLAVTVTQGQRLFGIGSAPMVPPTTYAGGTCPPDFSNNCYNYFWATYGQCGKQNDSFPGVQGKGWVTVKFPFSSLETAPCFGKYQGIFMSQDPNFKKQVLFLVWKFGDNGQGQDTYTDFWIDNVRFY